MAKGIGIVSASLAGMLLSLVTAASAADRPKAVVELFTSQGCSSCPPADALLGRLSTEPGVIALSYHIDYWDYLGWKDTLGRAEHTERQRAYARALGGRSIYTPQMIVNGRVDVNGAVDGKVRSAIAAMADPDSAMSVDVGVRRDGDVIEITAGPAPAGGKSKAHLLLVYFDPETRVTIERGENAGRKFSYVNSVTRIQAAGMWHGKETRLEIPASEVDARGGGAAVILQKMAYDGKPGPILGAAMLDREAF